MPVPLQPYTDNVGAAPMGFNDILSSLTGRQSAQQMPQQPQQQGLADLPVSGDPATLSGRIQQWLGAKPQDDGGQIQDILSGRFQAPLNMNDVGQAAQQTAATGAYVPAQQIANQRVTSGFDALDKLGKLQETQAQSNYYNAVAQNGGGRGEALALLNKLNNDPSTANLDLATKLTMVKAGLGVGNTMQNGVVQPIAGNLNTVQGTAQAKSTGEEIPKLQYAGPIATATATAKNNADITAAAPMAAQEEVGKARGEALTSLADIQANLPQLSAITNKLLTLGQTATYTKAGQTYNAGLRQLGLPVTQGGVDRAAYESTINNFLLPTLKQTFGARITNFDLENIKTTLANENLSPAEKDAQLKSFIAQKFMQAGTDQNQVNALGGTAIQPTNSIGEIPAQKASQSGGGGVVKFSDLPP